MKVLYLLENVGNYHKARLEALGNSFDVVAVEVYRKSSIYSWVTHPDDFNFKNYSLLTCIDHSVYKQSRLAIKKLKQIFESERPDCIAIPGWGFYYSMAALRWAKINNKLIIILSDSQEVDSDRKWLQEAIKSLYVKYCDGALVAGHPHSLYMQKLGVDVFRIRNSYDVVDNKFFTRNSSMARINHLQNKIQYALPARYFVAVSRLIEKKNIELLIYAYSKYRKAAKSQILDLVIVGDGEQYSYLVSLAKKLGVAESVHFHGFKNYSEIVVFYALAEALILPSKSEQWGLVVNEAMACGLPVLVSDKCGCAHDLVRVGVNGYIFESENCDDLVKYLMLMGSAKTDLKVMGSNSLQLIENWSLETLVKNFTELMHIRRNKTNLSIVDDMIFGLLERFLTLRERKGFYV